jgi:hypothetical protein
MSSHIGKFKFRSVLMFVAAVVVAVWSVITLHKRAQQEHIEKLILDWQGVHRREEANFKDYRNRKLASGDRLIRSPRVTFVVLSLGRSTLSRSLESLQNQSMTAWQAVVVMRSVKSGTGQEKVELLASPPAHVLLPLPQHTDHRITYLLTDEPFIRSSDVLDLAYEYAKSDLIALVRAPAVCSFLNYFAFPSLFLPLSSDL